MAQPLAPPRRSRWTLIPPAAVIAWWQLRQSWRFLLLAGLGVIAAVVLICTIPLFSQVAVSAGFRNSLSGNGNAAIEVYVLTTRPTATFAHDTDQTIDQTMQSNLHEYLLPVHHSILRSEYIGLQQDNAGASLSQVRFIAPDKDVASHVRVSAGQLPSPAASDAEIAITNETAKALNLGVGSVIHIQGGQIYTKNGAPGSGKSLSIRVVGIFTPITQADATWLGSTFAPVTEGNATLYDVLAAQDNLLPFLSTLFQQSGDSGTGSGVTYVGPPFQFVWYYAINPATVTASSAGTVVDIANRLQVQLPNRLSQVGVLNAYIGGSGFNTLRIYARLVALLQIPVTILLIQVMGLILLFVSVMAEILVERQGEAIAVMRSRGANRRHIFGALFFQTTLLGILALLVGPLLAIGLVQIIGRQLLPPDSLASLDIITQNPLHVALDVRWYALIAVAGAIIAMTVALWRSAGTDVLAMRREASRSQRRTLWQRLNLDIVLAVIGLTIYIAFSSATQLLGSSFIRTVPILVVFSLIAPLFLLVSSALIFLRIFPLVIQLGARIATRASSAPAMLALAQLSRAPRQSVRTTLLLALALGFALFTAIFAASQGQRITDVANYRAVSDFSGKLPSVGDSSAGTLANLQEAYHRLPGVSNVTVGSLLQLSPNSNPANLPMQVLAVDATTFAGTAYWSSVYSTTPLPDLMNQLSTRRQDALANGVVPAIVDDAAWKTLNLTHNSTFTLALPGYQAGGMHFIAIAHIAHIPSIYAVPPEQNAFNIGDTQYGGFLIDYSTYAKVYAADLPGQTAPPTNIWLRTNGDQPAMTSLRGALQNGNLSLTEIIDRRALISAAHTDPLQINLVGSQSTGATTALLLAIIGAITASWFSARSRLVNFSLLRALGAEPGQISRIVIWEQSVISVVAIGIGIILGGVLSTVVLPSLVFTNLTSIGSGTAALEIPPPQTILPAGMLLTIIGLVIAISAGSVVLMVRIIAKPSVAQTLRLNED